MEKSSKEWSKEERTSIDTAVDTLGGILRFAHLSRDKLRSLVNQYLSDPESLDNATRNLITFVFSVHWPLKTAAGEETESPVERYINQNLLKENLELTEENMTLINPRVMRKQLERGRGPVWYLSSAYITQTQFANRNLVPASFQCSTAQVFKIDVNELSSQPLALVYKYRCKRCRKPYFGPASDCQNQMTGEKEPCPHTTMNMKVCGAQNNPDVDDHIEAYYGLCTVETTSGKTATCYYISYTHRLNYGSQLVSGVIETPPKGSLPLIHIMATAMPEAKVIPGLLETQTLASATTVLDRFIREECHIMVEGGRLVKELLVLQAVAEQVSPNPKRVSNLLLMGRMSAGKTFIMKYYLPILYKRVKMTTRDTVSIASLRGSSAEIFIRGRAQKMPTDGHLTTFDMVMIDELLRESTEGRFVDDSFFGHLKPFLLEQTVDNSKVGGSQVAKPKNALVNGASNIDLDYLKQYKGKVRKAFESRASLTVSKTLTADAFRFDETLDYMDALEVYEQIDPQLAAAIKEVRQSYASGNRDWKCGLENAAIKRFPYAIFIRGDKPMPLSEETTAFNASKLAIENSFTVQNILYNKSWTQLIELLRERETHQSPDLIQHITRCLKKEAEKYGIDVSSEGIDRVFEKAYIEAIKAFTLIENIMEYCPRVEAFIVALLKCVHHYVEMERFNRGILE